MNLKQLKKEQLVALANYLDADFDENDKKEMIVAAIEESATQDDIDFALEDLESEAPAEPEQAPEPEVLDWEAENADVEDDVDDEVEPEPDISDLAPNVARRKLREQGVKPKATNTKATKFKREEDDDRILVRFTGRNTRYTTHGIRFSRTQPFYPVAPEVAEVLLEDHNKFRQATPKEVREFFA